MRKFGRTKDQGTSRSCDWMVEPGRSMKMRKPAIANHASPENAACSRVAASQRLTGSRAERCSKSAVTSHSDPLPEEPKDRPLVSAADRPMRWLGLRYQLAEALTVQPVSPGVLGPR